MAFRILSLEEIELLTEEQRKSYENELEIYNERVKFVEQLEKFENTVVSPYEPKFVNISDVKNAPEVVYAKPEYMVDLVDVDVNSVPEIPTANFDEPVTATVPKCLKAKGVSVEHIKKAKCEKPKMPKSGKTVVPKKIIQKTEQNKPKLPQIIGAVIPTKVHKIEKQDKLFMPAKAKTVVPSVMSNSNQQVNPNLPEKFKVKTFNQMPVTPLSINKKVANPVLPKSLMHFAELKSFKGAKRKDTTLLDTYIQNYANKTKAELPNVSNISVKKAELPNVQKTDIPIKAIHKFSHSRDSLAGLPTMDKSKTNVESYINSERKKVRVSKSVLPNLQKTSIPVKDIRKSSYDFSDLPTINKPKISVEPYIKPDIEKIKVEKSELTNVQKTNIPVKEILKSHHELSDLPTIDALKINVETYIKPELKKSVLPKVTKPVVNSSQFSKNTVTKSKKIEYPTLDIVPKISFKKNDRKINSMPSVNNITIPNAYANESIKNLLVQSRGTNEIGVLK